MDFRKIGGHSILLLLAFIVGALLWGYGMAVMGFDTVVEVGISLGFFLLMVLVYVLYSGALKTRVGKQVAG